MASEQDMIQAITQAAFEASKAVLGRKPYGRCKNSTNNTKIKKACIKGANIQLESIR